MANSQQILEIKLDARNRLLKSERRGVTIQIRKDGFTLRAYLPSKTNPESNQTIQQRVPINLKADIKNLDEAHRLAKKLSDEKIGGSFKWENWQKKEEEEVIEIPVLTTVPRKLPNPVGLSVGPTTFPEKPQPFP